MIFQPGEGPPSRGLLHNCEIFVNLQPSFQALVNMAQLRHIELHLFVNSAIRRGEHTWAWYLVISLKAASWLISWNPPSPWTNQV